MTRANDLVSRPKAPRPVLISAWISCVIWWGLSAVLLAGGLADAGQKPEPSDLGPALIFIWAGGWCYVMRAALNRRLVMVADGLLWAATLAGPRRVNINNIRKVDARLLTGNGDNLAIMILKDGDGRRLWLTQRMFDAYLGSVQQQIAVQTADVTPRASQILGLGPPVPRQKRILLGATTCALYVGSMVALMKALVLLQRHVSW